MSPYLLMGLGLLRHVALAPGMRTRHVALAETIAAHRARNPSERGWDTMQITTRMKDGLDFDEATGKILEVGGVCLFTQPHNGKFGTVLCEDGSYVSDWKCKHGDHKNRAQCPRDFPEMCEDMTCGGGGDYCCAKSCSGQGMTLRNSSHCEANALDLKHKFVNMIKDPEKQRWVPYSVPRMKAIDAEWANFTVAVAWTDEHADKNAIRPCINETDWKDKDGETCEDYERKGYCTPTGQPGEKWKGGDALEDFSHNTEPSAADACCACGGGYYNDPFLTSTTTTLEPSPEPVAEAPAPAPEKGNSGAEDPVVEKEAPPEEVKVKDDPGAAGQTTVSLVWLLLAAIFAS